MTSCSRGSEAVASLIIWEVTGSSLIVAVSIEEISGSKDIAATTESSGCFWCVLMSFDVQSNWLKGTLSRSHNPVEW